MAYDVELDESGDIPAVTRHITGIDLVVQRIRVRLNLHLGTYIADVTKGLDYLGFILQRPQDVAGIGVIIQNEINSTPGVSRVTEFTGEQDGETLRYTGRVAVETDSQAEDDLIALSVGISTGSVGNSNPAIVTYHRLTRIAPL